MTRPSLIDPALIERIEVLDGSRRRSARARAAVRVEDLAALAGLPARLASAEAASDPPSKAEHDALVADIRAIHSALSALAEALRRRQA